jgi:acyl transferase domain-containing protein/acyl carrier protein
MVFSGQGSHWLGMGRELMDSLPVFRARMEECDRLFQACTGWSILDELYNVATPEASRLASTDVMQPAIFAVQVALAAVWQDWGVTPAAVTGQSLGEVAAAFVAGALTLEEAVKIVAHRSRLMKTTAGQGLTAVVGLSLEQTRALLVGRDNCLSLAGSNSPSTSVLSGASETLTALVAELESQGIFCRILPDVDVAFHSYQMEPLVEPLCAALCDLQPVATRYPFYSAVTGALLGGEELNGAYWTRNLREPFLFSKVTERLLEDGFTCFLEVSPHPVLSGAIGQTLKQAETAGLILGSLSREKPELAALFASLGQLYVAGYPLNWPVVYPQGRFTGGIPAYPWQRERYWFDQLPGQGVIFNILNGKTVRVDYTSGRQLLESGPELHPLLGYRLALSLPGAGPLFQSTLSTDGPAYLQDHKVEQKIWLPGAAYLEMALAAARQLYPDMATIVLEDSRFHQGLLLAAGQSKTVQLALVAESPERLRFRISSLGLPGENGEANWNLHAGGTLQRNSALPPSPSANLAEIQARCTEEVSGKAHYEEMARRGLEYGPAFQTIQKIWRRNGEALGAIELSLKLKKELDNYQAHPTLLDAAFQLVAAALPAAAADGSPARTYLPESLRELRLYRPLPARLWARVRLNSLPEEAEESSDELSANFYLYDESGQVVASGHGFNLKQVRAVQAQNPARNTRDLNWQDWLYTYQWEQAERPAQPLPALNEQPPGSWLIFSDQDALGLSLGHKLEARGETVWLLYPAEEYYFDHASGQAYLNPGRAEDFSRLLHDLHHLKPAFSAEKLNLRGAIYLWGAELKADRETGEVNWEESINRDCLGVTYLVQALVKEQVSLARLCLVTRASQPVEGSLDNLALGQGMLWGLGGVIANEHLEFNCLRVDLSREPNEPELEALDAELWAANAGEQIALRQDQRYLMRLASYSPRNLLASSEGYRCQPEGAYLITGGLGGLGLVTAEYLIRQGARHLMLIGRSAPSPQALAQLEKWWAEGVDVRVAQADAGNAAQLETAFASLREAGLPLRGIIHSAMTLDDALVTKLTAEHFHKVLVSKLYGSWNLHRLSLEEPLDFFLLFSSVASVIGSAGQGNYVAGNAFMDGLAHYRQALGLPATSINWPAWEEVGFAARTGAAARLENVGVMSINPRQGLEALDLTLREELPQLIVLNARWERVSRGNLVGALISGRLHSVSSEPALAQIEKSTGNLSGLDRAGKQAFCEKYLIEMLSEILNCPAQRLDKSLTLYSLGLDSLIAVSMKNELENGLKVSVPMETIMQGPTIAELATVIVELLSGTSKKAGVN